MRINRGQCSLNHCVTLHGVLIPAIVDRLHHAFVCLLKVDNPSCDYTPPEYITLLFTDLGILTPSAVSDELIKLYY